MIAVYVCLDRQLSAAMYRSMSLCVVLLVLVFVILSTSTSVSNGTSTAKRFNRLFSAFLLTPNLFYERIKVSPKNLYHDRLILDQARLRHGCRKFFLIFFKFFLSRFLRFCLTFFLYFFERFYIYGLRVIVPRLLHCHSAVQLRALQRPLLSGNFSVTVPLCSSVRLLSVRHG